jgi:hypothetical protein
MSSIISASSRALVLLAGLVLAGCANDGTTANLFTTGALGTTETESASATRVDPACTGLAARIETLRKEGVADKIEKAATKKYTMTKSDLTKADQLTKASAEFEQRCSTVPVRAVSAQVSSTPPAQTPAKAKASAAKTPPKAAARPTAPSEAEKN